MNRLPQPYFSIRKLISVLLPSMILTASLFAFAPVPRADSAGLPFRDIAGSYAKDAIVRLYQKHLIDGTGQGYFEPAKPITRAELTAMIGRVFGLEPVEAPISGYIDVSPATWYYPWVMAAVHSGIATGVSANAFEPNRLVTRQEAAVLLARAANLTAASDPSRAAAGAYADQTDISAYALDAVMLVKRLGLMQGDGRTFRPKAPITRQEAAVLLDRARQRGGWAAQIAKAPDMRIQLGWQYALSTAEYKKAVLQSGINTLAPRWLFLDKTGLSSSNLDPDLVEWAHRNGKRVWVMVGNRFNQQLTHDALSDADKRRALVDELFNIVNDNDIDGLNVDFENVGARDRASFTAFIGELSEALGEAGAALSVDLSPDMGTDWTEAYDYAELGKLADYIVLMGYDEHWSGGSAGSVSSLPWLQSGLGKLLEAVPASKVILGLPLYTRNWPDGGTSEDWTLKQQNEAVRKRGLSPQWQADLSQYTAQYRFGGKSYRLWLEDGRSLSAKVRMGERHGVAGYAYWYMGSESADVWTSLRNAMRFAGYRFK